MIDYKLRIGKYAGKTIFWIALNDPNYLLEEYEKDTFSNWVQFNDTVKELIKRIKKIKPENINGKNGLVKYTFQPETNKLLSVELVDKAEEGESQKLGVICHDVLDLSAARLVNKLDKSGGKMLGKVAKKLALKPGETYVSKTVRKRFFNDETKFDL